MWPWEHAIVGYVAYSVLCHACYRDSPGGFEAAVVAFASVLPDLIDKPLAWEYGVFQSGYALGHSVFFAVPLAIAVGLLARRTERRRAGIAFAVGYLLHLPADVLDTYLRANRVLVELLLWPVVATDGAAREGASLRIASRLFAGYRDELLSGDPSAYLLALLFLSGCAVVLWVYDGIPPIPQLLGAAGDVVARARARLFDRTR